MVAYLSAAVLEGARDGLWKPAVFGAKPARGGMIAVAAMGDPNAWSPARDGGHADAVLRAPPEVTA